MARKFETHVHTADIDPVSTMTPEILVDAYKARGYDGIVITNHYFKSLFDWYPELENATHEEFIDKYLFGYRKTKEYAQKVGVTVLLGAEIRFDGKQSDYLLYGASEDFFYETPLLNRMKLDDLIAVLPEGALLVQAHPFRDRMEVTDPKKLFGVEVYNGRTKPDRNAVCEFWAKTEGLAATSGSDCHKDFDIGKGGILFDRDIKTEADFAAALRAGDYRLIKDGKTC